MQEENMSEKGDELLQAAVAQDGTMAAGENGKKPISPPCGHRRRREKKMRNTTLLILHFAALWGFMIYIGDTTTVCYCAFQI